MRIAIDARMMGPGNTRGIGRYIEEMVRAMREVAPKHQYVLLERDPASSPFAKDTAIEHVKADVYWYGLAEQLRMPGIIKKAKADLLFVPHWNISWFCSVPRVVFIHDLILLEEPNSANASTRGPIVRWIKRIGHRVILHRALFSSRAILVPTQHVADRISHHYSSLKTPIVVTGEGMPRPDPSTWKDAESYLLTVGSAYPHKNHETLLRAWPEVAKRYPDLRLVIAGKKDAFMKAVEDRIRRDNLPRVECRGEIPEKDLPDLYAKALALVFPSRWEGFALPPLEALAYGIPVLSSNASCMPEVLGTKGVITFNPGSSDDILHAVENLLENQRALREDARIAGGERALIHDWKKSAERTIREIEKVS